MTQEQFMNNLSYLKARIMLKNLLSRGYITDVEFKSADGLNSVSFGAKFIAAF
jgi:hypothetical protein